MAMQMYDDLVRIKTAELHAEAEWARRAERLRSVRTAERRYRKAKVRLVAARLHAANAR